MGGILQDAEVATAVRLRAKPAPEPTVAPEESDRHASVQAG